MPETPCSRPGREIGAALEKNISYHWQGYLSMVFVKQMFWDNLYKNVLKDLSLVYILWKILNNNGVMHFGPKCRCYQETHLYKAWKELLNLPLSLSVKNEVSNCQIFNPGISTSFQQLHTDVHTIMVRKPHERPVCNTIEAPDNMVYFSLKYLQKTPHSLPVRASYWVSFVNSPPDYWFSVWWSHLGWGLLKLHSLISP